MIVIAHQTIGEHFNFPPPMGFSYGLKKTLVILIVNESRLSGRTAVHDVVDGFGVLNTQGT
jgi:hypothetical protein